MAALRGLRAAGDRLGIPSALRPNHEPFHRLPHVRGRARARSCLRARPHPSQVASDRSDAAHRSGAVVPGRRAIAACSAGRELAPLRTPPSGRRRSTLDAWQVGDACARARAAAEREHAVLLGRRHGGLPARLRRVLLVRHVPRGRVEIGCLSKARLGPSRRRRRNTLRAVALAHGRVPGHAAGRLFRGSVGPLAARARPIASRGTQASAGGCCALRGLPVPPRPARAGGPGADAVDVLRRRPRDRPGARSARGHGPRPGRHAQFIPARRSSITAAGCSCRYRSRA